MCAESAVCEGVTTHNFPGEIVGRAVAEHSPNNVFAAVSGGNDSTVLLAEVRDMIDGVVHVNTGIGIEETRQYVRDLCQSWNLPLIEMHPPDKTYEDFVLEYGFPGPAAHIYAYSWLKERALRNVRRQYGPKVMLLTGVRKAESKIRMGRVKEVQKDGNLIWVAPILDYGIKEMAAAREKYDIPVNPVPQILGMSGECLCGAFATFMERELIRENFPVTAKQLDDLEALVALEAPRLKANATLRYHAAMNRYRSEMAEYEQAMAEWNARPFVFGEEDEDDEPQEPTKPRYIEPNLTWGPGGKAGKSGGPLCACDGQLDFWGDAA